MKVLIKDGYIDLEKVSFVSFVKEGWDTPHRHFIDLIVDGCYYQLFYKDKKSAQRDFDEIFRGCR